MTRTPFAYAATYLLWGATFLGIRIAVQTLPPFMMSALRFLVAGVLVLGFVAWRDHRRRGDSQAGVMSWPKATVTGALFCLGTHGIVPHIARAVPSGVVAVVMATIPLWIAVLTWLAGQGRPSTSLLGALLLGLAGVAVLAWPTGVAALAVGDVLWLLGGALCWAVGSLLTRAWGEGLDLAHLAGRQMVAGSALLWLASGISGEGWLPTWPGWTTAVAVLYLALGGTIAAYFSYLYLLRTVPVARASSYTFVNPVVAVALGAMLAGEALSPRLLIATPLIVLTIFWTLRTPATRPPPTGSEPPGPTAAFKSTPAASCAWPSRPSHGSPPDCSPPST